MDELISDPILQFFTAEELKADNNLLYTTLGITVDDSSDPKDIPEQDIKKAYRKSALLSHPDKHVGKSDEEKEEMGKLFKKVGFAWAVLSDEGRRKRYDETGRTDESFFAGDREGGWEAYFEAVFQKVDKKLLDEDKARYEGSEDELADLRVAFLQHSGSLPVILESIPHSTTASESRLIAAVDGLISSGALESTKEWEATSKGKGYEKAKKQRVKEEAKEAGEAEKMAKELGVWEEFYGNGAKLEEKKRKTAGREEEEADTGASKAKFKKKAKTSNGDDEEDVSALAALIQSRQKQRAGAMEALMEKYGNADAEDDEEEIFAGRKKGKGGKAKGKGKERKKDVGVNVGMPTDEEFAALQAKLFSPSSTDKQASGKGKKRTAEEQMAQNGGKKGTGVKGGKK